MSNMKVVKIAIEVQGVNEEEPFFAGVEFAVHHDDIREAAFIAVQNCQMDLAKSLDIKEDRIVELIQDQIGNIFKQSLRGLRKGR